MNSCWNILNGTNDLLKLQGDEFFKLKLLLKRMFFFSLLSKYRNRKLMALKIQLKVATNNLKWFPKHRNRKLMALKIPFKVATNNLKGF